MDNWVNLPFKTESISTKTITAYDLPPSKDSLMTFSGLGGGLIACLLLELINNHKNTQIAKMLGHTG